MILCNESEIKKYEAMIPGLRKAFDELYAQNESEVGRYELSKGFYMIQKGTTVPINEGRFEAHERYIDVQILVHGEEIVEWASIDDLTISEPYNTEKDCKFLTGNGTAIEMKAGMIYILFPEDAHKPCCHFTAPKEYHKIVIKLPIK